MAATGRDLHTARQTAPRSLDFALFVMGLLWLLAARSGASSAAQGIAHTVGADGLQPLLEQVFLLILLVTGFTALHWMATRDGSIRASVALPWRGTVGREWQKGAAFGWALLLLTLLPMAVVGDLHPQFRWTARAWGGTLLSLLTLFFGALATEMAFRGFLFRRLIAATGPVTATVLLSAIYAFLVTSPVNYPGYSFPVALASGVLFSVAYLRTHALWLGWGLRFGWLASMGVLFGLPLAGSGELASVVTTDSTGRDWLTGGAYGPEGAAFTALVLLLGAIALYTATREYAWAYTHAPIVAGGYPMDVPPPAAHTAMEAAATAPPQLVQILGTGNPPPPPFRPGTPPMPTVGEPRTVGSVPDGTTVFVPREPDAEL